MELQELIERVREQVVRSRADLLSAATDDAAVTAAIRAEVRTALGRPAPDIEDQVVAHLVGLGPVDALLRDPAVSEIMINAPDQIFVERHGRIEPTGLRYRDDDEVLNVLYRIVQRCGRRVNFSSPLVDASLPDGSRVNAIIPPAARHPVITIRRFVRAVFTTEDLLSSGFLTDEMVRFFRTVVRGRANIVVCGSTGSGKTTFLRWLAGHIPPTERLITIEDTRELNLEHPHCISLEASDKAGIYELMINALRMRPDRILLGEVRGAEAFDLFQAMGTGHDGALTSVHANYGNQEALHRIVRAMLKATQAGGVTADELETQVAEAVDLFVFVKRFPDGSRRVVSVSQVESQDGRPAFRDIFRYRRREGRHEAVGTLSRDLLGRLQDNLDDELPPIRAFGGEGGA